MEFETALSDPWLRLGVCIVDSPGDDSDRLVLELEPLWPFVPDTGLKM